MNSDRENQQVTRMPDTYLVIAAVAVLVFVLGYFVDPGVYELLPATGEGQTRPLIDADSYRAVTDQGRPSLFSTDQSPGLFNAVYEGLVSGDRSGGAVGVMAFILITGGAFGVVLGSGSINRAINLLVARQRGEGYALLAALFVVFSLCGAVFGMGEEVIPFVLMLLPVLLGLGFDRSLVVMVTFVATQIGFATSWMNPFSVAIAQGIADLPLLSGMPLRVGMWLVFTVAGLLFCLAYAKSVHQPASERSGPAVDVSDESLATGDYLVLVALLATITWLCWGVVFAGYYLPEIATQFLILGVAAGVISIFFRLDIKSANGAVAAFRRGAADLLPAALVVGLARGIVYLMGGDDPTQPSLLNTLLYAGSNVMGDLPSWLAAWCMFLGQSVFNFFVTSGSGQAALTMPIMAPMADLIGLSRQVAVLAFQLGDGLTNIVVPTSAALMGCLGAAGIDWLHWLRVILRLYVLLFLLGSMFMVAAVFIGYQ